MESLRPSKSLKEPATVSRRLHVLATAFAAFMAATNMSSQTPANSAPPAVKPRKPETFLHKVLRISGISASPSALKGPGDEVVSGQVWLVEIESKKTRNLSVEGGYSSPVFAVRGGYIFALHGSDVVRFNPSGGNPQKVCSIPGIQKLVGASQDDADKFLILRTDDSGNPAVALLAVSTGKLESVPYDSASSEDRQMIEHLRGWDRMYGDKSVFVKRQSKQSLSGPVQWADVFLKEGTNQPVNVSACDEVNCGQPSLSSDGTLLVFIRAEH
jgi:hypothetical protein